MVSVIIPVYNEIKYLYTCVESVLNQTYQDIEVILVDDGSTNKAARDCDALAKKDSRLKVIHQENQGLSAARMNGFEISTGEWVMFVDNDDKISRDMIRVLLSYEDDAIDIIAGWKSTEEKDVKDSFPELVDHMVLLGTECCDKLEDPEIKWTPLWGKLYRRDFLEKIDLRQFQKICPTIFFEDILMNPILSYSARKICIVKDYFYYYRVLEESLCHAHLLGPFYYEQIDGGDRICSFLKEKQISHYFSKRVAGYIKDIIRLYCLIDYDQKIDDNQKIQYVNKILKMYRKWINEYLKNGADSTAMKILVWVFPCCKNVWKKMANKFFFSKNNKHIMQSE